MRRKGSLNAPFWSFLPDISISMNGAFVTYVHCTEPLHPDPKVPEGPDAPRAPVSAENNFLKVVAYKLSESPKVCSPDGFAAGGSAAREGLPDTADDPSARSARIPV